MNRSATFIKCSSSISVPFCSQIYCTENGDMRDPVSIFSFRYHAPHEAPQGERSSLWERVFVTPFNGVFREVPGLQIPKSFFYCLGIP